MEPSTASPETEEHRESVRAQLAEVQDHLAFVERKIAIYEERIDG
jgi:hypothetical protein